MVKGQPVRRTLSVWIYGQKINDENCEKPKDGYISIKVLHNNPDMKWITNPWGQKRTTQGDVPLKPADPLKYKHVYLSTIWNLIGFECKN